MGNGNTQMAPQMPPAQQNALARSLVLSQGVERIQSIYNVTVNGAQQPVITVNPRNVGLIKGFFVKVTATLNNPDAATPALLTALGPANILSQITFTDLQNNTRIQTSGAHLHLVNTVRNQRPFGLSETLDTSPIAYGNNFDVISAPAQIAAASSADIVMYYYVPMAYSNADLRGAIYANVVNATMQLQLNINQNAVPNATTGGALAANAVYLAEDTNGTVGNVTINVYQHYIDQLPMTTGGPILPMQDLATIYELKNTNLNGLVVNQDFTIPYANFRTFLSTFALMNNLGAVTGEPGADINYWALRSANFTDIFKFTPFESALLSRLQIGLDFPSGTTAGNQIYYFNHRDKPINTIQYGNMELVMNPAQVGTSAANIQVGYEDFAMINVVSGAGSLPAGG